MFHMHWVALIVSTQAQAHVLHLIPDVINGSANGNCNNSAVNGASQPPKFDPIIEEESEDTHL